jgi:hypothetical protein
LCDEEWVLVGGERVFVSREGVFVDGEGVFVDGEGDFAEEVGRGDDGEGLVRWAEDSVQRPAWESRELRWGIDGKDFIR